MNKPTCKTLQDMKTLAGSLGARAQPNSPHSIYLKIAMLQIERERRSKEHTVAMARAARSSERMRQIEEEVLSLQSLLDGDLHAKAKPPRPAPPEPSVQSSGSTGRVFRF